MHDDLSKFRKCVGVEPMFAVNETDPEVAKQRLFEARVNCELLGARAKVRAKLIVANLKGRK